MALPKPDYVTSGAAPVVVSVIEEGKTIYYFFDNLTFYETGDSVQLVGSKKRVEVEAERELESVKEEQKTGGSTVILPIESQAMIADEIRKEVMKSFASRRLDSY